MRPMSPRPRAGHSAMSSVRSQISISLDGFLAGPNQSLEEPLGEGGGAARLGVRDAALLALHGGTAASERRHGRGRGGRPERRRLHHGPQHVRRWRRPVADQTWDGWWGDDPPYHVPVFVLTHHARAPLDGGRHDVHFVTDGVASALAQARAAAGDRDVVIAGGAHTIQQSLAAGRRRAQPVDRARAARRRRAPARSAAGDLALEPIEVVARPRDALRYRVVR